jgi:hypothetical protein
MQHFNARLARRACVRNDDVVRSQTRLKQPAFRLQIFLSPLHRHCACRQENLHLVHASTCFVACP